MTTRIDIQAEIQRRRRDHLVRASRDAGPSQIELRLAALEARLTALERRPVSSYRPLRWGVQVGKRGAGKAVSKLGWGVCS